MSVEFEEQFNRPMLQDSVTKNTGLFGLVIKSGLVKNREQAVILFLVCAMIFFVISIFIFLKFGRGSRVNITPAERAKLDERVRQIENNLGGPTTAK